jgi:hypothetical protein
MTNININKTSIIEIIGSLILLDRKYTVVLNSKPITSFVHFEITDKGFKIALDQTIPIQIVNEFTHLIEKHNTQIGTPDKIRIK